MGVVVIADAVVRGAPLARRSVAAVCVATRWMVGTMGIECHGPPVDLCLAPSLSQAKRRRGIAALAAR